LIGRLNTRQNKLDYLNFYGNLMELIDGYLVDVLKTLDAQKLTDNTLVIRTADHGEMGLAHGGMRQKCFNAYEETIRVPLVYSNPKLLSKPRSTKAMVSHVDLLPTLASLVGAPDKARARWQGIDYSAVVRSRLAPAPQDYVVFTYDDWQVGQTSPPYVKPPQHVIAVRERRWKIAEYWDVHGKFPASGRCTTSSAIRTSATTSPTQATGEPRPRSESSAGCNASWPRSRRRGCGRCGIRRSPRPTVAPTWGRRAARWTRAPLRLRHRPGR
jgi:arylsulfatase A-like enzyme